MSPEAGRTVRASALTGIGPLWALHFGNHSRQGAVVKGLKSHVGTFSSRLRKILGAAGDSETGASAVEYSILIVFIATAIVAIVGILGLQLVPGFQQVVAGL
jgi:Flp pilus assembly pilin Flp